MPAIHVRKWGGSQSGTIVQTNELDVLFLPDGAKFAYRVRKDFIQYPVVA